MKRTLTLAAFLASVISSPLAHATHDAHADASSLSDGEIRKVDRDAKKLTIRHGPLHNLGMPAMTMVFQVNDATMLEAVNIGDKVKFNADKVGGAYTVTHLEPVR